MVASAIAACVLFSDPKDLVLGGEPKILGALMLIVFLAAGMLWVLTDILQQIELSAKAAQSESVRRA